MTDLSNIIHLDAIRASVATRRLSAGLIAPAAEETHCELAPEHAADPIKSMDDIDRMSRWFIENGQYRDNMLFIVGINFGLRASDLRMLRFSNLINDNCTFKEGFHVFEKKTRNTRKRKKNRYITINDAVVEAVTLYLEHTPGVTLSDYMFRTAAPQMQGANEPIAVNSIRRILVAAADGIGLNIHVSTHTLRKTFCYWMMMDGHNDQRRLLLLQKMLNHSSPAQTLDYIGLTAEEMEEAYKHLNLGSAKRNYMHGVAIYEREEDAM